MVIVKTRGKTTKWKEEEFLNLVVLDLATFFEKDNCWTDADWVCECGNEREVMKTGENISVCMSRVHDMIQRQMRKQKLESL
jgi:hypothetical protein